MCSIEQVADLKLHTYNATTHRVITVDGNGMHARDMKISLCNFSYAVAYESRFPHTWLCVEDFRLFPDFHWVSNDVTDGSLSLLVRKETKHNFESTIFLAAKIE